jgi:aminoglycoside/choline kinase family phosphotransferase
LRLGDKSQIARDLMQHRAMEAAKYPVAPIISEGELGTNGYFIEKSLGPKSFRAMFQEDCTEHPRILDEHFNEFVQVVKKLYGAQIKARTPDWNISDFAAGVNVTKLSKELPAYREQIEDKFVEAVERLKKLPGVLNHGDCNPSNIYEDGIIDLEDSFVGPLGYDIVSALMSIEWSPRTRLYEFYAQYRFTDEQRAAYMKAMTTLGAKAKIPALGTFFNDLAYCRALWLCSGMQEWPRIQQWRYEKLIAEYLS